MLLLGQTVAIAFSDPQQLEKVYAAEEDRDPELANYRWWDRGDQEQPE